MKQTTLRRSFRKSRCSIAEFVVEARAHDVVGELGVPARDATEIIRYVPTFRSQIEIEILSLPSPITRNSAFDTAAQGPAGLGRRLVECKRSTRGTGRNATNTNDTRRKAYVGAAAS